MFSSLFSNDYFCSYENRTPKLKCNYAFFNSSVISEMFAKIDWILVGYLIVEWRTINNYLFLIETLSCIIVEGAVFKLFMSIFCNQKHHTRWRVSYPLHRLSMVKFSNNGKIIICAFYALKNQPNFKQFLTTCLTTSRYGAKNACMNSLVVQGYHAHLQDGRKLVVC